VGRIAGIYVPYWTYDSMTYTHYTGQRGDHYWETETYTERDASGQEVTRTRQVMRTRWTFVSGEVQHFFDDVLICASTSVAVHLIRYLEPWELKQLEDFQPQYLSGFQTERYAVGLKEGFAQARQIMDGQIRQLCNRAIGGDEQQLQVVQTQHVGITFKHILLPVWVAAYRYRDRSFQVLINARSGAVTGDRPYSWAKIVMLVMVILALIGGIVLLMALTASRASGGPRSETAPPAWQAPGGKVFSDRPSHFFLDKSCNCLSRKAPASSLQLVTCTAPPVMTSRILCAVTTSPPMITAAVPPLLSRVKRSIVLA
jgi:hypothetical protein